MRKFLFSLLSGISWLTCLPAYAVGESPPAGLIAAEEFARRPKLQSVQFSFDGKRFAALQEINGRMNLTVGNLKEKKLTQITNFTTFDVGGYRWISNGRLVFSLHDSTKGLAEQRGGGLFAINHDGTESKELSPTRENCAARGQICRQTSFFKIIDGSDSDIIAIANDRDIETSDLYRLNTRTGKKNLLTSENPGHVSDWFIDKDNVPRAAVSEGGKSLSKTFWFRDAATSPWRKISSGISYKGNLSPAAFDGDGGLLVYSNLGTDKSRLYTFDAAKGVPGELVAEHPLVDINSETSRPILQRHTGKIVGWHIEADKPEIYWFDAAFAKLQATMDASLAAGNINSISPLDDGRVLVYSSSERDPGAYYLYDPQAKQLQEVLRPVDWLKPERMAETQVLRYKARDGLEIPGYLTLPRGMPPRKLPIVAWIHGGPWVRDAWGWNADVQFLASRGYAVFQPNYRGSSGFGEKHFVSSFKKYGQTMQDDITDGILYLIEKGIVDPDRICIGGGSYGGYATMMGLVKEPKLFRCGINEAGVVDLVWAQELGYTDFNQSNPDAAEAWYRVAMGDVKADRAMLEQYSPRLHAGEIKAPVLIVHGAGDQRVPIKHAEGMRDALTAAGKTFEWLIYPEEGHGFTKPANRIDRYKKIEAFLQKNLGGIPGATVE